MDDDKNIEIDFIDSEGLNVVFYEKGIVLMLMNDEAKELRDVLVESLSI